MPTEYAWFLPSARAGDGHKINIPVPERPPTIEYLSKVARAAEEAGFVNLLVPTGTHCLDAWVAAASVAQNSNRIKFCVALRPGLTSPVFAAQTCNTLDWTTGGRVTVNVVTGSTPTDQMRYGDHLRHEERYERTLEFLDIIKELWKNEKPVTFKGKHFDIRNASFFPQQASKPFPPIYLGGSSEAGRRVGAKHSDVHMSHPAGGLPSRAGNGALQVSREETAELLSRFGSPRKPRGRSKPALSCTEQRDHLGNAG